ncbi:peptidase domain-containing ABC transporter [[Flexibacter] sp. ATCC 35208]|uniref:peptidase domain-containing ABC transporter n=1 Tax=[Flexibacter] sp. ATCC 35208 TaxID=1936242 RepID=UPI0009D285C1|nr:peptidase domain-containing ABC transporter [[Flexibacter] sp. ATCC 35208]OMP75298.1 ABC transporter ATP-binding protein [[Flexibacter] sp. ATCC 35208]
MKSFVFYKQLNAMDCGPTCLRMIARFYGRHYNADTLRQMTGFGRQGVTLFGISDAAEKIGFRTRGVQLTYERLQHVTLPCILHWDQNHYIVLLSVAKRIKIANPGRGIETLTQQEFLQHWISHKNGDGETTGIALLLEPSPAFYEHAGEEQKKFTWKALFPYLRQNRWQITQVMLTLLVGALLQLVFPFLTQSIVDTGITIQNMEFIVVILVAQLMLTFSKTVVDFIRSRLLLKVSNILNLSILSDFWIKLSRLPISYFDAHQTGDTLQRIGDHKQIQNFLTGQALNTLFSLINFFVYAFILATFSMLLFEVFLTGSVLYFLWISIFLPIRRKLNFETFQLSAKENNTTLQLVLGMHEIKLNNAEQQKRWGWENIQALIFKLNLKSLSYQQWQQTGAMFINQSKDILITFLVAKMVIEGNLTLGTMLAVQYIVGQLNSPLEQFISLVQNAQDAKMSLERLQEVHQLKDEEPVDSMFIANLPENKTIDIKDLSFAYPGPGNLPVLKDITLEIPEGSVTAIVGASGSGKTTLLKLLLKFYHQFDGDIKIGDSNFKFISPGFWRSQCGAVLQDGFIFNDTIAGNIAVREELMVYEKLVQCCKIANILSFIESLPNGFHTQLGAEGVGLSQGQKQRLLIARALYKDPKYLFFDEATNALDAHNEKIITASLDRFFRGRTVVVVAHRLSTVKNADKIIVLHEGRIVEEGSHEYLSAIKGRYYELVKNQLELGN